MKDWIFFPANKKEDNDVSFCVAKNKKDLMISCGDANIVKLNPRDIKQLIHWLNDMNNLYGLGDDK